MKYGAFLSYSHDDAENISPIIKLISTMRKDLVFQDTVNLKPGKLWEPQLLEALHNADIIIVFWCRHAANSKYVRKEYNIAIKEKKDVLSLLFDDTKLPRPLAKYQWIDFRNSFFHKKDEEVHAKNKNILYEPEVQQLEMHENNGQSDWGTYGIASTIFKKLNEKLPPRA